MKIIWTKAEYTNFITDQTLFPLAKITVEPMTSKLVEETFPTDGTIKDIIVSYPGGIHCLVTVSMWLHIFVWELLLPPLVGDNQVFYLNVARYVKFPNKLKVDIRNNDSKFEHTVGVRVDVF